MNDHEYERLIAALSQSRRVVFDAVRDHGPLTDNELVEILNASRSTVIPRRSDLVHEGLVRGAGSRPSAAGKGRATIFEVVPAEEVESARKVAEARGPRRLDVKKWPFDDKVRVARALLRDPEVNEAIRTAAEPGSRRARARARQEIERGRRERAEQIRREQEEQGEFVSFLKARDHLKRNVEAIREVDIFLRREQERDEAGLSLQIPAWGWTHVLELLDESIGIAEGTYDRITLHVGSEPRSTVHIIEGDGTAVVNLKPVNQPSDDAAATTGTFPDATTDG